MTEATLQDENEEPLPEIFQCPVCGSSNDVRGCCSKACYDLWTAPDDSDPREAGF
jgi:transcription elongation factor Elf1